MQEIRRTLPSLSYVVARSRRDHVIGCENKLPWKLSTDLQYFKKVTSGHVIIMGRRTLDSIGKPLPNRINIVLSSEGGEDVPDKLLWAKTPQDALFLADHFTLSMEKNEIFVVGGQRIYSLFSRQYNRVHLTEVDVFRLDGDAHFRESFDLRQWKRLTIDYFNSSDIDQYNFTISVLERKNRYVRQIALSEFMREKDEFEAWKSNHKTVLRVHPRQIEQVQLALELAS